MTDIDDDESCFDPTECSAELGPTHDDAGVETGGWEDEPVQAGSRASAFPIMKTDPRGIPFQSAFDHLVAAIRELPSAPPDRARIHQPSEGLSPQPVQNP